MIQYFHPILKGNSAMKTLKLIIFIVFLPALAFFLLGAACGVPVDSLPPYYITFEVDGIHGMRKRHGDRAPCGLRRQGQEFLMYDLYLCSRSRCHSLSKLVRSTSSRSCTHWASFLPVPMSRVISRSASIPPFWTRKATASAEKK